MESRNLSVAEKEKCLGQPKRVLAINDSADNLDILKTLLETEDCEVFTAQSGMEALSLLSKIDPPDLILLDCKMAGMSGSEFLLCLKEIKPKIFIEVSIVFFTAKENVAKTDPAGSIKKSTDNNNFLKSVHGFVQENEKSFPNSTSERSAPC